eukprot:1878978-Prymnesium_polylepis.1
MRQGIHVQVPEDAHELRAQPEVVLQHGRVGDDREDELIRQQRLDDRSVHKVAPLAEVCEEVDRAREVDCRLLIRALQPRGELEFALFLEPWEVLGVADDDDLLVGPQLEVDEQLGRLLHKQPADAPLIDADRLAAAPAQLDEEVEEALMTAVLANQ